MTWQFTLSGLLIGLLVGMTGMGGGSLLTPILVIFFGFKPTLAVGTDILHGAIFKSFGAVRHRRLGTVHARLTLWMFLGSGPMSLLGVAVATWLSTTTAAPRRSRPTRSAWRSSSAGSGWSQDVHHARACSPTTRRSCSTRRDRLIAVALGATCGFVVGLTSVGSGTFFGLIMVLVFPLTRRRRSSAPTSSTRPLLLWVAGFGHLVAGNVDLHTMALAADRLDPGRPDLEPVHAQGAGAGAAARARRRC